MSFEVIIVIIVFFGLLFLNVPIAFCIGAAALLGFYTMATVPAPFVMSQRMATGIASFPPLAIPFFLAMVAALLLITYLPFLTLWLPGILGLRAKFVRLPPGKRLAKLFGSRAREAGESARYLKTGRRNSVVSREYSSDGVGMRVTGGIARGIELSAPKGGGTRPATDRMREAVFSSLAGRIEEARVVDLFAGSGAYGLEAWSRGASSVVFVENHPGLTKILQDNVARVARSLGAESPWPARVRRADALSAPDEPASADVVFADPPYALLPGIAPEIFRRAGDWLVPQGKRLLVFETPGEVETGASGWTLLRRFGKGRGQPAVSVFRLEASPESEGNEAGV